MALWQNQIDKFQPLGFTLVAIHVKYIFIIYFYWHSASNHFKKMSVSGSGTLESNPVKVKKNREEQQHQQSSRTKSSGNLLENEIYSTTIIWLSRGNRPTLYLPMDLAKKHGMNKPCRIAFYDDTNNKGILIKFLHDKNKITTKDNGSTML